MRGNFFDRLAARALGVAPVSQPILPSLFSPVAKVGAMEYATAASEGGETPAPAILSEEVRETVPNRILPRRENSPETGREPDAVRREPTTRDFTLPEIGESPAHETTVIPPQVEMRVPPRVELELKPRGVLVASHAANVAPTAPEETSRAQREVQPVIVRGVVRGATDSSPRGSVQPEVAERTSKNSSQSVGEPVPPVVRVTIGRVDVRAQFPVAPSAPATGRPRASTLSLEDYLKQRTGGRR